MQRGMMMRLGGVEKRFSFASSDASFRNIKMEGRVELRARLAVDGSLAGLHVIEPAHPALAQAAEAMVRQWRPDPVRLRGVPVEVPVRLTVDFRGAH
jgi:TonB family protein